MMGMQRCLESLDEALESDHQYEQWLGFQVDESKELTDQWFTGRQCGTAQKSLCWASCLNKVSCSEGE